MMEISTDVLFYHIHNLQLNYIAYRQLVSKWILDEHVPNFEKRIKLQLAVDSNGWVQRNVTAANITAANLDSITLVGRPKTYFTIHTTGYDTTISKVTNI